MRVCRNYTGNNCQIPPFCSSRTKQVTECGCEAGWTGPQCDVAANKFTVTVPANAPQEFSGPYRASSTYGTDNMLFTKVTAGHANTTYTVRKADDGWEMVRAVRQYMLLTKTECEGNDLPGQSRFGIPVLTTPTAEICDDNCKERPDSMCNAWTWNGTGPLFNIARTCILKSDCPDTARSQSDWATSGQFSPLVEEVVYYNPMSSALPPISGWVHDNMGVEKRQVPTISYEIVSSVED